MGGVSARGPYEELSLYRGLNYSDPFGLCPPKDNNYTPACGYPDDKPLERQGDTIEKVGLVLGAVDGASEGIAVAELGSKLEYLLGKATGSAHNIARSEEMAASLRSIGLGNTTATRAYLTEHLNAVVNDATNIVRTQANGRVVRESLLMGRRGAAKLETVWEETKLITAKIFKSQ